ncbi:PCMD domain-containing protein [Xylanibacter muris]|uniref:Glycoside hydrolase xylanase n=1 Tax=Xylanibacter muris TaxID=2736290 RepID=A0ABX2AIY0_9BACT|nr:PCMD domain-containing protein [Xylanibacter muris]NPD90981.1 glycoside hydrolase xylanase [Xylanibacter muris]
MRHLFIFSILTGCCIFSGHTRANDSTATIKYGDMNHWVIRNIKESGVIGGNIKTLYEIGPDKTLSNNEPYKNMGGSPWGTSNVMAKVMGVVKTNNSVYRDTRDKGYCAKMTTHIETCKVLGLMNIKVLAAGSIFLGDMKEPITGTKDGPKALNFGIPFSKRPKAVKYDYKTHIPGNKDRIKLTGFSGRSTVPGKDYAITVLFLQKRHEDTNGNITAERVGTMVVKYGQSTQGWVNGATYEILYGDIRNHPRYDSATMGLRSADYARNSRGNNVPVKETGWAKADARPTHLILQFSSSHGGAYIGTPGNTLWIDNVALVY